MSDFKPITTQEELDQRIKERLRRERIKATKSALMFIAEKAVEAAEGLDDGPGNG